MQSVAAWCQSSCVKWVQNFISGRSIRVKFGNCLSGCRTLNAGVPQGSHLGPLLFNLAINSLPETATSSLLTLFADDANLLRVSCNGEDVSTHISRLQGDIDNCWTWSQQASAQFNAQKCKHVIFAKKVDSPLNTQRNL